MKLFAVISVMLTVAGCTSMPGPANAPTVDDKTLLAGAAFPGAMDLPVTSKDEVFRLSPAMIRFIDENVVRLGVAKNGNDRVFWDLVDAMGTFGIRQLVYNNQTLTAAEAFEQRSGNCLSFTNMFLVMARQAGLNARFQEVKVPPDWIKQGEMMVLRRHVNVFVRLAAEGKSAGNMGRVVDFDDEGGPSKPNETLVSDNRALAHFYNNWAVDALERDNQDQAFAYARRALVDGDMEFSPAWGIIGVLYRRVDRLDLAEAAHLRALQADPSDTVAMSNLQRLYESQGRVELADYYKAQVLGHRLKNPYYRLMVAQEAYQAGDYPTAVGHLRKAISMKSDESEFYFLLRDSYYQMGDMLRARQFHVKGLKVLGDPEGVPRRVKPKAGT